MPPINTVLTERALPKQCHGRGWRRRECKVSDFLRPHTPTLTHPASYTAPFPSPPPTDEKVCHQRTNTTHLGWRGRGALWLGTCGACGEKEVSRLPRSERQPVRTDLDNSLIISGGLQTNWGNGHSATGLRPPQLEEAGEDSLNPQAASFHPKHPAASWEGPP